MGAPNLIIMTLAINGLALTLALGLFLLVLWLNPRRQLNLYFGMFLFMVMVWTVGTILSHAMAFMGGFEPITDFGVRLLQVGFVGASVAVYPFTAVLVGSRGRLFAIASISGLLMVVAYQAVLLLGQGSASYAVIQGQLEYGFSPISTLLFSLFGGASAILLWFQRRRVHEQGIVIGVGLFIIGQLLGLLNPFMRNLSLPVLMGDLAVFLISLSLLRQQVINPLVGRASQLETVRDVGLVIVSRLRLDGVLAAIAGQAVSLLEADAAAIFRLREDCLEVAVVHNLPAQFVNHRLPARQGLAGRVAVEGHTIRLDDYSAEWQGVEDLPLARSTFGSVIAAPLVYSERTQGILLVIQGRYGKIFSAEQTRLLELLGPQAAVAIANSELFEQQRMLTDALTLAKNQLETVLTSTQSPVLAVDRSLRLVFSNPAANMLLLAGSQGQHVPEGVVITDLVPSDTLPPDFRTALRTLREQGAFVYELSYAGRAYLCHLAPLGGARPVGWVAVLNDVTELKELDRFKSQMVRLTSHDLKNPLFAAMSNVELLDDELDEYEAGALRTYVTTTMQQLDRMNRTISSILDLERIQSGQITYETCHLAGIAEQVIEEFAPMIDEEKLLLEVDISSDLPPVLGDQRQLARVLANLVENAIKFTPNGGGVLVELQPDGDGVLLTVKDTGVGIPRELHSQVFERFFRAQQSGVEHVSGSGLGLSLVRDIVMAHRGRVWLESELGEGTAVHVWLPVAAMDKDSAVKPLA